MNGYIFTSCREPPSSSTFIFVRSKMRHRTTVHSSLPGSGPMRILLDTPRKKSKHSSRRPAKPPGSYPSLPAACLRQPLKSDVEPRYDAGRLHGKEDCEAARMASGRCRGGCVLRMRLHIRVFVRL